MQAMPPSERYRQALAAFQQGRHADALAGLRALLAEHPGHGDGWNLAGVIQDIGRDPASASACFEQAIAAGAGAGAMANLGLARQKLRRWDLAEQAYRQAIQHDPGHALAWQKLGALLALLKRGHEALHCYREALRLDPSDLKTLGDALFLRRHLADWDPGQGPQPAELLSGFTTATRSDFPPMLLLAMAEADAPAQLRAAAKFARSQWAPALARPPLATRPQDPAGRRLRVGYLSSDFRDHAVSYLTVETIAAHDRATVEVFLYAHGPARNDAWRRSAVEAADHFIELGALDDHAAARRIFDDGIDVLVDLNGYTQEGRPGILALRPAAVIATWLGYVGTLGEPRLADFVISDAVATPPELEACFSESLALMPHCFQANSRLSAPAPPPSRASQGLPDQGVVFCSFNQTFKLHPALWDDWCEILRGVPGSVLWLAPPRDPSAMDNLRAETQRRGVAPERLVFADQQPREQHLARLALADIALDTWPYNSGTTASDALRMGVPLLAFPGDTFVGRMAASLLGAAGMPECIGRDRSQCVAQAIALGNQPASRERLRRQLHERLPVSRLFRPDLFARDLERLLAAMQAQKRAGLTGALRIP